MEKRFREFLKHFEKLDYDVLSDEEIIDEKTNLGLKTTILHQEMVRLLICIVGLLICVSIFLASGITSGNIICYVLAALLAVSSGLLSFKYRGIEEIIKKLDQFADKLTML